MVADGCRVCTLEQAPTRTRDQATVGGNMVRLYKLLSAFLDQNVQKRFETNTIISRLAFETIVNAQYLAQRGRQQDARPALSITVAVLL
jgi:hypothetical protein